MKTEQEWVNGHTIPGGMLYAQCEKEGGSFGPDASENFIKENAGKGQPRADYRAAEAIHAKLSLQD